MFQVQTCKKKKSPTEKEKMRTNRSVRNKFNSKYEKSWKKLKKAKNL